MGAATARAPARGFLPAALANGRPGPRRLGVDPEKVQRGVVALVLALIELVRRLLLKQAVRRVDCGRLTPGEVERMGLAMMRLEETMDGLKAHFGLTDDDLNLDLGPLGRLF